MLHGYARTTKIQAVANALHSRPRMLIYINSWPSAGKKTIGALLAARLKARFDHNHHFLDFVEACCGRSDPQRQHLYGRVREAAYESLAHLPAGEMRSREN